MSELSPIETTQKLTQLRNLLDRISQVSWSFSVLNKRHPISEVQASEIEQLITAYEQLLDETSDIVKKWQN